MSILVPFLEDLGRTPEDWILRSVLADWCEDNQQLELASCLRWMIKHHKRPYHASTGRATWFNADTISSGLGDPESDLPGVLFQHLESEWVVANHKAYASSSEAELAFQAAWMKARAGGWKPDV